MAHCSVYSVPALHTLVIAILVLSVSRVLLINGQVGNCSGTGCMCNSGYHCCLAVQEEDSGALVGNATIGFTMTGGDFSVDETAARHFVIDSSGGIRTNTEIDRETDGNCFFVSVTLTVDGMSTARLFAVDILDINDHVPQFTEQNYTFVVPETLADQRVDLTCPQYQSSLTAMDNDDGSNGRIKYRIVSGSDYFTVQEDSPCIRNTQELDFETNTSFTVVLEAQDGGIPPLSSNVTIIFNLQDLNDNAPRFTAPSQGGVTVPVPEDREVGSLIYHFMAVAADSGTNGFYFDIPQSDLPFELNSTTGEMTIASALNFEDDRQYVFMVEAIGGSPSEPQISSVTVTVMIEDINEAADVTVTPLIPIPYVIVENQIFRAILDISIMDPDSQGSDNRNNSIRILKGSEYFDIQQPPFIFAVVRQLVEIDREITGNSFNLVLELTEGNSPVLQRSINATIEVRDVNDNAPRLNQTVFYFLENEQGPETITVLGDVAFDPDNGSNGTVALYELISVVNQDGVILTNSFIDVQIDNDPKLFNGRLIAPQFDREEDGRLLNFTVKLTDGGAPRMSAEVTFLVEILDVNNKRPQFSSETYAFSFAENLPVDSSVGRVYASDADNGENGTIIYTIVDEFTNFSIDPCSGEIRNLVVFDREVRENYTILVSAHDNGSAIQLTATAPVTVVVMISDENDNPPVFMDAQMELSVPSNAAVGTIIGRVEAVDRDKGENAVVNYRLYPSVLFSINNITGDITVAGRLSAQEGVINVDIAAFNPGSMELEDTLNLNITITIVIPKENITLIAVVSVVGILLLMIVAVLALIIFLRCRNRRGSASISSSGAPLNNVSKPKRSILRQVPQVPATNGTKDRRGVQFLPHVQETMYDHKQAVVDDLTVRTVETKTKFDESPLNARIHHNGTVPLEEANGDIPNQFYPRQRSPLIMDEEVNPQLEFSQSNTMGETGHYNPYGGNSDDESTFADDVSTASNMNTLIPCFEHPTNLGSPMRYVPPLHPHSHPQHTSPSHVMGPLLPHSAQYPLQNSGTYSDNTLTPLAPDPQHNHRSMSPSPAIPPQPLPYIGMAPGHHIPHPNSRRNYPLVMPDAYCRDTPEDQRFQTAYVPSFASDYDTSTYASSELDEVLDFNEVEHGVYTLSATEYEEDTQL